MPNVQPAFILCHARSGSTLLRYLLDAHPDIACPAETTIPMVCISVAPLVDQLLAGNPGSADASTRPAPTPRAVQETRAVVDRVMDAYLEKRGKSRWCDKSLITMVALDQVTAIFPDARFVCLYRHPMDFIMSALEAAHWGVAAYGFENYTKINPDNLVAGLADYWIDRTRMLLAFEQSGQFPTHRVYYENLSFSPRDALRDVLDFLGEDSSPAVLDTVLESGLTEEHEAGSGDYKVDFTSSVSRSSVGRGRTIPADKLVGPRRTRLNKLLAELGYALVEDDWNAAPGGTFEAGGDIAGDELSSGFAVALTNLMIRRLERSGKDNGGSFALAVIPAAGAPQTWQVDTADRTLRYAGSSEPPAGQLTFSVRLETLRSLLSGSLGFGDAVPVRLISVSKDGETLTGAGGKEMRLLAHLLAPFTIDSAADALERG